MRGRLKRSRPTRFISSHNSSRRSLHVPQATSRYFGHQAEAVSMAEIHATRELMRSRRWRQVEYMSSKVDEVRKLVIKLETREYQRQI